MLGGGASHPQCFCTASCWSLSVKLLISVGEALTTVVSTVFIDSCFEFCEYSWRYSLIPHIITQTDKTGNLCENASDCSQGQCSMVLKFHFVHFRSFVFSPDVPIRLDYHGKRVDMEQVRNCRFLDISRKNFGNEAEWQLFHCTNRNMARPPSWTGVGWGTRTRHSVVQRLLISKYKKK